MFDIKIPAALQLNTRTEYGRLHDAVAKAQSIATAHTVELQVVDRESGTVAREVTYVEGRYFHPNERVETPRFAVPSLDEWAVAYTRRRIEATVYRHRAETGRWLVRDGRTGGQVEVTNTKAACALTKAMRLGQTL